MVNLKKVFAICVLSLVLMVSASCGTSNDGSNQTVSPKIPNSQTTDRLGSTFLMNLPFTSEHEPFGIMPMGETINHSPPEGHPGIDFQWPYEAPITTVIDGEIVDIIFDEKTDSYSLQIITGEFMVQYEVTKLYVLNPSLKVGDEILSGQTLGYAIPIGLGDGVHMIHWAFGEWRKHDSPFVTPEGVEMNYSVNYFCPVPYFTEAEKTRLEKIWEVASYNHKEQFPKLCNGFYETK